MKTNRQTTITTLTLMNDDKLTFTVFLNGEKETYVVRNIKLLHGFLCNGTFTDMNRDVYLSFDQKHYFFGPLSIFDTYHTFVFEKTRRSGHMPAMTLGNLLCWKDVDSYHSNSDPYIVEFPNQRDVFLERLYLNPKIGDDDVREHMEVLFCLTMNFNPSQTEIKNDLDIRIVYDEANDNVLIRGTELFLLSEYSGGVALHTILTDLFDIDVDYITCPEEDDHERIFEMCVTPLVDIIHTVNTPVYLDLYCK